MKITTSTLSLAVGLAMFVTIIASASQYEGNFQPSPNGQFVVSVVKNELSIPIPPEGIELNASVAVRIRDAKGKEVFSVPVAKGRKSYETGYGYVSTDWSPNSQMLAFCNQGSLSVVAIGDQKPHKLLQSVSSFRWIGISNLCCVTGPLEDDGLFSVTEIAANGGTGKPRPVNLKAHAFHPWVSEHHNQLSSDSRNAVFIDGTQILVSNLHETNSQHVVHRKLTSSFCWWIDSSDRCLVHGLEEVKTTKPFPEDTTFRDVIYLYETNDASFTDLTDYLRKLNSDPNFSAPRPMAEDRVWSPQGKWFLVSGVVKGSSGPDSRDWICVPKPWSSICVQEILGKNFHHPKVAPSGSKVAVISAPNEYSPSGDLYLIEIKAEAKDKPVLEKPLKIASSVPNSWFWSADGRELIVWNGRNFTHHPIPTQP